MTSSEIRKDARTSLKGKWGTGVLTILLSGIIESVLLWIVKLAGGPESTVGYILNLIVYILMVPLSLGLVFAFMKIKRNEEVSAFDFVKLGFSNFIKAWKLAISKFLALIIPVVINVIGLCLIIAGTIKYANVDLQDLVNLTENSTFTITETGSPTLLFVGFIIFLIGFVYSIVKNFAISLTEYIAYDEPEAPAMATVRKSQELMKGNKAKLFFLGLSFIGWAILSVLTFGIGALWLIPYVQVAYVCFYDAIISKKVEEKPIETPVETPNE